MIAFLPRRAPRLIERNLVSHRNHWPLIVAGFMEPLLYLLSIGVGIGALVGRVELAPGRLVPYAVFVAPAMLAASAMNGAIFECTFNVFFKLTYAKTYEAILATPVGPRDIAGGEIAYAVMRGGLYSAAFVAIMAMLGYAYSPLALVAIPVALLVGFSFAAVAMATTTFMSTWQHFDLVQLAVLPMFLLSATFFPLSTYPPAAQWLVELTPLYHGVHLLRGLTTGSLDAGMLLDLAYLVALGTAGLWVTSRRLEHLLVR